MHSRVRLSLPPGEQDSDSSLDIRPLNTPQLPVELWDEIGEILSENVVASTAQDLLNVMLSCRELFQIFIGHLYKFNKRMIEISSLPPPPGSEPSRRRKPKNTWTERSAMQWAARNGLQGTAQAVREITPDLCQVSHVGVAIRHQHYEFAWMLLKWKEIDEKVAAGVSHDSPIFAAVAMNHAALIEYITKLQGIKFLMTEYILSLFGPLKNGQYPLHRKCLRAGCFKSPRSSEMLSVLINHGLDVNQTVERMPLLMHALRLVKILTNTIGVVKDLLSMIQDIDQQDLDSGDTSLMFWLRDSQEMAGKPGEEALCLEITKLLLDHGASLDSRNKRGDTPLHIATAHSYPSVVQLLIDRGADVNATGNRGQTALHWATSGTCSDPGVDEHDRPQEHRSAIEKVAILIKAHADPDFISESGSMALRPLPEAWLCHDSFEKMVKIYTSSARDRGDPINVVDFLHRCPSLLTSCALIMKMADSGSEKMEKDFEFLLGYGLDIDEHNYRGRTLLDLSLTPGSIPGNSWLFMYLLSKGAKINATNQNGKNVLDRTRDVEIRDLLIRHGALPGSQLERSVGN
ncbi:unnamed protein product [Clonostachys solani]|uniref:Uncharacterized protein n=1 Tax=Clonostachys solani TaxID=160281 RepID=A0A9P0EKB3_9HYPO|nr:unnamed protein product [Clonostachys solani]